MNYLKHKLKFSWQTVLLVALVVILFFTNYSHGTFLMGWDNFQTELNPHLSVKRAFFSVWEEFQSFGLVAGMAHAADLVRAIFVLLLSFVLPQSIIRYAFHFLMILTGVLGMLHLLKHAGFTNEKKYFAFLGALFYLLNFGTIQIHSFPFEPFSVFYGFLPWEILIFLKVVEGKTISKKAILTFLIINLLATPQSVLQQLFFVYILVLGVISVGILIKEKTILTLKRIVLFLLLIFVINSFWILPQLYFLKTSRTVVLESKINQLSTENILYSNLDKGNIKDFLTLRNIYYDLFDSNEQPLFQIWKDYHQNTLTKLAIYSLILLPFIGLFLRTKYRLSFIFVYLLVAIALLGNTFPLNIINQEIRNNTLINQIFRSPFTKFVIPYSLVASYFFACGAFIIFTAISFIIKSNKSIYLLTFSLSSLIIFSSLPAFEGNFISPRMKVQLPSEYFSLMDYFKNIDKSKRIALLPEYTFWGWFNHKWGYDGSGFLWYGIEQPIVSRNFDMWSNKSESYFWEIKNALENEDINAFEKILEKYDVNYLIFDHSLLPIIGNARTIQYDRVEQMLSNSLKIILEKQFNFISVYKIKSQKNDVNFVSFWNSMPNIGPSTKMTNEDNAYKDYGTYITNEKSPYDIFYPFLDFSTQARVENKDWQLEESFTNWSLARKLPFSSSEYETSTKSGNIELATYDKTKLISFNLPFNVITNTTKVIIQYPKVLLNTFNFKNTNINNCGDKKGILNTYLDEKELAVSVEKGAIACFSYEDNNLEQRLGYLVKIQNENKDGQRLFFYVLDKTKNQPYIEDRLKNDIEYYVIGSRFSYGIGYAFSFRNTSYKNIPSINKLSNLSVYLMPYEQIKQLKLVLKDKKINSSINKNDYIDAQKTGYFLYHINKEKIANQDSILSLSQSFHEGWRAFKVKNGELKIENWIKSNFPFIFGEELKEHVLVNNWANGWSLPNNYSQNTNNYSLIILFWPQYLEYLGFMLIGISILWILRMKFDK